MKSSKHQKSRTAVKIYPTVAMNLGRLAALAASLAVVGLASAVELTFELPDNAKECFFEVIEKGTEATVEFQVRITRI